MHRPHIFLYVHGPKMDAVTTTTFMPSMLGMLMSLAMARDPRPSAEKRTVRSHSKRRRTHNGLVAKRGHSAGAGAHARGLKQRAPESASCPAQSPSRVSLAVSHTQAPTPWHAVRRKITSTTALRIMHVTQDMMASLSLPDNRSDASSPPHETGEDTALPHSSGQGSDHACLDGRAALHAPSSFHAPDKAKANTPLSTPRMAFVVTLLDTEGNTWPITYEQVVSANQYHRRFHAGWRDFCCHHQVRVGDTIEFQRVCPPDPTLLQVKVLSAGRRKKL
jgi:hypothetical protein